MKQLTMLEIFSRLELKASAPAMAQLINNIAENQLVDRKTKHDELILLAARIIMFSVTVYFNRGTVRARAIRLVQCIAKKQEGVR